MGDKRPRGSTASVAWVWLCGLVLLTGCPDGDGPDEPSDVSLSDAGDTSDLPPDAPEPTGPETVTCRDAPAVPEPDGDNRCAVGGGNSRTVLLRGTILSGDTVYERGSVLVDRTSGEIACAGCGCGTGSKAAGATVVGCPDAVVSPGLINPHDHLGWSTAGPADLDRSVRYDHRHEWRVGANDGPRLDRPSGKYTQEALLYGELRHLAGGATSVAGSARGSNVEGLLRNLDANEAGVGADVEYSTFPLGDTDGTLLEDGCDYGRGLDDVDVLASDTYLPHISEGITESARNEWRCLSSNDGDGRDLVDTNTTVVHGIGMTASDIRNLGADGGALVWSPRSNIALYGHTADVLTYRNLDVPVALGTDWAPSGSHNILGELQCADSYNRDYLDGSLSDWELWRMVTTDAADVLGVGDQLGDLRDGYRADITIIGGDEQPGYGTVVGAEDDDVVAVLSDGKPVYGDTAVMEGLVESTDDACSTMDGCGRDRTVCIGAQTDGEVRLEDLEAAAGDDSYPVIACADDQIGEPTCTPSRPGEYDGSQSPKDPDGDGLTGADDNCPAIFNPKRPLESRQPDADDDGMGDACDPCPLRAGDCDPDDRDDDGQPDHEDNCPYTSNPDQHDADDDGIGDACDDCPEPNPDGAPCPTSPYELREQFEPGSRVRLDDVVVTAVPQPPETGPVEPPAMFVQVSPDDSRWTGPEHSGIYVYVGSDFELPSRGEVVSLSGVVKDFFGLIEIGAVSRLESESASMALPDPVEIEPDDVAGDRPDHPLVGSLVTTSPARVTDDTPDENETQFGIDSGLEVGDLLYVIEPPPKNDGVFDHLTGPLHYSWNATKILPRDEDDVGDYSGARKPGRPETEGTLVITEIMPDPDVESDSDGEWFEIHHPGGRRTYNLHGCDIVEGGDDVHSIEKEIIVAPGSWVALARSDSPGFDPDYVYSGIGLTNSGGELALRCRGSEIDAMSWDGSAVKAGKAWSLDANQLDAEANDDSANWCFAVDDYNGDDGTPGAENPVCSQ